MIKKINVFLIFIIFLVGCNNYYTVETTTTKITSPEEFDDKLLQGIKEDMLSNLENIKYLKVNTFIKITFNQETKKSFTLSELDYVNNKARIHYSWGLSGYENKQEYYREGDTFYKNVNGLWERQQIKMSESMRNPVGVIKRIKNIKRMDYLRTEEINFIESYLFRSEIDEKEALEFVEGLFEGAIYGSSGNFVIKEAETKWWINKETKELIMDLRTINSEIDGVPVEIIYEYTYTDYNIPIDIKTPEGVKQ